MVVKTFDDIKELARSFRQLWEKWGFEVKGLEDTPQSFKWVIKWKGNLIRPVEGYFHSYHKQGEEREVIWLYSDDKYNGFDVDEVGNADWSFFRGLTEWIVLAAARIEALEHLGICPTQVGKTLGIGTYSATFFANFHLRRVSWVWEISKLDDKTMWMKIKLDSIKRAKEENPIPIFVDIVRGIMLSGV